MLRTILRQIFCRHEYEFHRRMFGDEIVQNGFRGQLWRCKKCWRFVAR